MVPSSSAQEAPRFPDIAQRLFLTGESGATPAGTSLLLQPELAGTAGTALLLLPGVELPVETDPLGQKSVSWHAEQAFPFDMELRSDAAADLHFLLHAGAVAEVAVALSAVAPNGTASLLGEKAQQFVEVLPPGPVHFALPTAGTVLPAGHVLRLDVVGETADAAVLFQYDSAGAPSALDLVLGVRDRDSDGIPDSEDPCPADPDCDGDGVPDGDEDPEDGDDGTDGRPGSPGSPGSGGDDGDEGDDGEDGDPLGEDVPRTYYEYYLIGLEPPTDPPGPQDAGDGGAAKRRWELVGGGSLAGAGLLVSLGGLFGRHPL